MKVLVYSPDGMVSPVLYAVAKNYSVLGHDVIFVECQSAFDGCSYNLAGDKFVCKYCVKKNSKAKAIIDAPNLKVVNLGDFLDAEGMPFDMGSLEAFKELRDYEYKGYDLGYSVISTTVNDFREFEVESYNAAQKKILKKIFISSHKYVDAVEKLMDSFNPSKVVIFNGRLISTRPMLRFCQNNNIDCEVYEITGNGGLNVFENTMPHDDRQFSLKSKAFWDASGSDQIEASRLFFERKRNGEAVGDYSYTAKQNRQHHELNEFSRKKNIVVFNSSPDELVAIGDDYSRGLFDSQSEAVRFLCENLKSDEYNVVLRIHPNLYGVNSCDMKRLLALKGSYSNLTVIEPESLVSSYYILGQADKVITFGSTIGVEATYWGKISILLNKAIWEGLDIAYRPSSKDELLTLVNGSPKVKEVSGALMFAHYVMNYGEKSDSFSWSLFEGGKLNGKSCEPALFYKVFYGIYKMRMQFISGNKIFVDKFFAKARRLIKG